MVEASVPPRDRAAPAGRDGFPGGLFEIDDVSAHECAASLTWVIFKADGMEFARGGDQIGVDNDGTIIKITTFAPSGTEPAQARRRRQADCARKIIVRDTTILLKQPEDSPVDLIQ